MTLSTRPETMGTRRDRRWEYSRRRRRPRDAWEAAERRQPRGTAATHSAQVGHQRPKPPRAVFHHQGGHHDDERHARLTAVLPGVLSAARTAALLAAAAAGLRAGQRLRDCSDGPRHRVALLARQPARRHLSAASRCGRSTTTVAADAAWPSPASSSATSDWASWRSASSPPSPRAAGATREEESQTQAVRTTDG